MNFLVSLLSPFRCRYIDSQNADGSYTYGFEVGRREGLDEWDKKKCLRDDIHTCLILSYPLFYSGCIQGGDGTYKIETRLADGQVKPNTSAPC